MSIINDHLVLVSGKPASGKSASLLPLAQLTKSQQQGVIYLNCESGKRLPFRNNFRELTITDPYTIYQAFEQAESMPDIHTIVVDTLTFLMDIYESTVVLTSADTMKGWSNYAQYFKNLMAQYVAKSTKNVIFLAHTSNVLNEAEMITETCVQIKGSIMKKGIESYFSNVVASKKIIISKLTDDLAKNSMLTITEEEQMLGFKHIFQTRLTKDTVNERIRSPIGLWAPNETYIDNNILYVIKRLTDFYCA